MSNFGIGALPGFGSESAFEMNKAALASKGSCYEFVAVMIEYQLDSSGGWKLTPRQLYHTSKGLLGGNIHKQCKCLTFIEKQLYEFKLNQAGVPAGLEWKDMGGGRHRYWGYTIRKVCECGKTKEVEGVGKISCRCSDRKLISISVNSTTKTYTNSEGEVLPLNPSQKPDPKTIIGMIVHLNTGPGHGYQLKCRKIFGDIDED